MKLLAFCSGLLAAAVPLSNATADLPWTPEDAAWSVAKGLLSEAGAEAWRQFRDAPSPKELHEQTVRELAAIIREEVRVNRLGQAESYFTNAKRELQYYLNNPAENKNSLDEARTQSGFALSEFSAMGVQSFRLYMLCSVLHMAVLKEKVKLARNKAKEEQSVAQHLKAVEDTYRLTKERLVKRFSWDANTLSKKDVSPNVSAGQIVFPDVNEIRAREYLVDGEILLRALRGDKGVLPILEEKMAKKSPEKNSSTPPPSELLSPGVLVLPLVP